MLPHWFQLLALSVVMAAAPFSGFALRAALLPRPSVSGQRKHRWGAYLLLKTVSVLQVV